MINKTSKPQPKPHADFGKTLTDLEKLVLSKLASERLTENNSYRDRDHEYPITILFLENNTNESALCIVVQPGEDYKDYTVDFKQKQEKQDYRQRYPWKVDIFVSKRTYYPYNKYCDRDHHQFSVRYKTEETILGLLDKKVYARDKRREKKEKVEHDIQRRQQEREEREDLIRMLTK